LDRKSSVVKAAPYLAAVCLVVLASACSNVGYTDTPKQTDRTPGTPSPVEVAPDAFQWPGSSTLLAEYCPSADATTLPIDSETVIEGFVCTLETDTDPVNGEVQRATVYRIGGGLDRLLREYRIPDQPSTPGAGCPADLPNPGLVWLHTRTGITTVRAPTTGCSHPLEAAAAAFRALTTTFVAEEEVDHGATT